MIKEKIGNIFASDCETIVNAVNCVGVMGKGIALEFALRFPEMESDYKKACAAGELRVGNLWIYDKYDDRKILNFPTKTDYKYPSKIEYIKSGLEYFVDNYKELSISSVAFPMLGANNGKIDHDVSLKLMREYLAPVSQDIEIEIYTSTRDWVKDEYFIQFLDFISRHPDRKIQEKAKIILDNSSINNFTRIVEAKEFEFREDGTIRKNSIFTKNRLQALVREFRSRNDAPPLLRGVSD